VPRAICGSASLLAEGEPRKGRIVQVQLGARDRRRRRLRHLDLGRRGVVITRQVARVRCGGCGVRAQALPSCTTGRAFHTRLRGRAVAWLCRRAPMRLEERRPARVRLQDGPAVHIGIEPADIDAVDWRSVP
jgi:hypothetical protein